MTVHLIKLLNVPFIPSARETELWRFADLTASRCRVLPRQDAGISGLLRCRMAQDGAVLVADFDGGEEAPEGHVGGVEAESILASRFGWYAGPCQIDGNEIAHEINPGWPVVFVGFHGVTRNIPDAAAWLAALCESAGARAVTTSYLRRYGTEEIEAAHPGVPFAHPAPWVEQGCKGAEIDAWLGTYSRRRYVVVDTSSEAAIGHETRFVEVSRTTGLDQVAVDAALEILSRPL